MDITPNLTLIVQMLNFIGAYFFIRILLVKPVFDLMEREKTQAQHLKALIAAQELFVTSQRQKLHHHYLAYRENLANRIPVVHQESEKEPYIFIPIKHVSTHEVEQSIKMVSETIVKKVTHVQ